MANLEFDSVKDSGKRQEFDTGSKRDTREGKGRYDLMPGYAMRTIGSGNFHAMSPIAVFRLARHYENGAVKYGPDNWLKGQPLRRYLDSAIRHMFKVVEGMTDEDHQAAAIWNMVAFVETKYRIGLGVLPKDLNDMPLPAEPDHGMACELAAVESPSAPCLEQHLNTAISEAFKTLEGWTDYDHAAASAASMMRYLDMYHKMHSTPPVASGNIAKN